MLELHYRTEGVALSLSLCHLSRASPLTRTLYTDGLYTHCVRYSSVYCLVDRSTNPQAALSARVLYLCVLVHVAVDEIK